MDKRNDQFDWFCDYEDRLLAACRAKSLPNGFPERFIKEIFSSPQNRDFPIDSLIKLRFSLMEERNAKCLNNFIEFVNAVYQTMEWSLSQIDLARLIALKARTFHQLGWPEDIDCLWQAVSLFEQASDMASFTQEGLYLSRHFAWLGANSACEILKKKHDCDIEDKALFLIQKALTGNHETATEGIYFDCAIRLFNFDNNDKCKKVLKYVMPYLLDAWATCPVVYVQNKDFSNKAANRHIRKPLFDDEIRKRLKLSPIQIKKEYYNLPDEDEREREGILLEDALNFMGFGFKESMTSERKEEVLLNPFDRFAICLMLIRGTQNSLPLKGIYIDEALRLSKFPGIQNNNNAKCLIAFLNQENNTLELGDLRYPYYFSDRSDELLSFVAGGDYSRLKECEEYIEEAKSDPEAFIEAAIIFTPTFWKCKSFIAALHLLNEAIRYTALITSQKVNWYKCLIYKSYAYLYYNNLEFSKAYESIQSALNYAAIAVDFKSLLHIIKLWTNVIGQTGYNWHFKLYDNHIYAMIHLLGNIEYLPLIKNDWLDYFDEKEGQSNHATLVNLRQLLFQYKDNEIKDKKRARECLPALLEYSKNIYSNPVILADCFNFLLDCLGSENCSQEIMETVNELILNKLSGFAGKRVQKSLARQVYLSDYLDKVKLNNDNKLDIIRKALNLLSESLEELGNNKLKNNNLVREYSRALSRAIMLGIGNKELLNYLYTLGKFSFSNYVGSDEEASSNDVGNQCIENTENTSRAANTMQIEKLISNNGIAILEYFIAPDENSSRAVLLSGGKITSYKIDVYDKGFDIEDKVKEKEMRKQYFEQTNKIFIREEYDNINNLIRYRNKSKYEYRNFGVHVALGALAEEAYTFRKKGQFNDQNDIKKIISRMKGLGEALWPSDLVYDIEKINSIPLYLICPSRLNPIPIHFLPSQIGKSIISKIPVMRIPSSSFLLKVLERKEVKKDGTCICIDSEDDDKMKHSKIFPNLENLWDEQIGVQEIIQKTMQFKEIYFNVHGQHIGAKPNKSHLNLRDGIKLTVGDILLYGDYLGSEINLFSCDTAAVKYKKYYQSHNISSAFLQKNAKTVLSCLWSVQFDCSVEFAKRWVEYCNKMSKSYAFQKTLIECCPYELHEDFAEWLNYSCFVLNGIDS